METLPLREIISSIDYERRAAAIFLGFITLSFSVRVYVRIHYIKHSWVQDSAMIATFLFAVMYLSILIGNATLTIEILMGNAALSDIHNNLSRAQGATFVLILIALKISVGYLFLNIFPYQRFRRLGIYSIMICSATVGLVYIPVANFTCSLAQFKEYTGSRTCPYSIQRGSFVLLVMFSIVNIIGDFGLCLSGCFALWDARLPRFTKVSTIALLSLGSIGGIASVIRLSIYMSPNDPARFSQQMHSNIRWMYIEIGTSVIAANLALTKPLFQDILLKLRILKEADIAVEAAGAVHLPPISTEDAKRAPSDASSQHGLLVFKSVDMKSVVFSNAYVAKPRRNSGQV